MAKYRIEVLKEYIREYEVHIANYFENLLQTIRDYKNSGCKISLGTKWIKIYDSQNNSIFEERPYSLSDFIQFCREKGIKFIKK